MKRGRGEGVPEAHARPRKIVTLGTKSLSPSSFDFYFDKEFNFRSSTFEREFDLDTSLSYGQGSETRSLATTQKTEYGARLSRSHDIAFIFIICLAQAFSLAALCQTIVPLDIIGEDLGMNRDAGQLSWLTSAYSLTVGTFILPAGRLGDLYGHKLMYLIGFSWFGFWSLIAGFSVHFENVMLTVCRAFQGIGPAILVPNALALVGREYDEGPKKNMLFSLYGAAAPTGWCIGAAFSAVLAQLAWWPWSFWILGLACWIVAGIAYLVIPADEVGKQQCEPQPEFGEKAVTENSPDRSPPNPSRKEFDYCGCILGVTGLVLFNFAWSQAAVIGWKQSYIYVILIFGLFTLLGFIFIELRVATDPLLPFAALKLDAYLALGCVAAGWASFGVWVYYLWRLIEHVRGHTPLAATAQTSPIALTGLMAAVVTGWLLSKLKPAYILFVSMLFFVVGMSLLATVPEHQTYWGQLFVTICIMPLGMDMSFPSGTIILSNAMSREHQGLAASLVNTIVNYSISIGLGIAGTIERYRVLDGASELQAYRGAWYFGIGLDVLGLVIAAYFVVRTRLG